MLVLQLGRESYERAWELQHRLVHARQEGRVDDILILLEHDPVITLGRAADPAHVLASPEELQRSGISLQRVERGGDVTYHGPGQLVGYPILSLQANHLGVSDYMHKLEEVLIRTLGDCGLSSQRRKGLIGVWIGERKIAALGARVERGVTYHGFALNVAPRLEHFSMIIPCGLIGVQVTSLEREMGKPASMEIVRERVVERFGEVLGVSMHSAVLEHLPL